MREAFVKCLGPHGFHRMHYTDWGNADNPQVVLCVHGFTRNNRDFDWLAQVLAADFRVVCPDVVGRGHSDWLQHGDDYKYPQYLADITVLLGRILLGPTARSKFAYFTDFLRQRYGQRGLYWVGTSMGGLIGMMLAAQPRSPIRKLVMNDVGPWIPKQALERIGTQVNRNLCFTTLAEFGILTDEQWQHLARHGARQQEDGRWAANYDPNIGTVFRKWPLHDVDLWNVWDGLRCSTLVLRGANSDLLVPETVEKMQRRGPPLQVIEFADVGHAPMLMAPEQIAAVKNFLQAA
jgi:pimeloyl-ACP methyl ester carboxylesterase